MNAQIKTVLLTVLTLSVFVLALVELSGVSSTALFNKYGIGNDNGHGTKVPPMEIESKTAKMKEMPKTTIQFDTTKHDFGTIKEGTVVKHSYHFKNTGEHPLLISNAVASCGCTVPSYPKEPIPPGGEGDIEVEFNSKGRKGHQEKNVLVYSNAQLETMSIGFVVEVKEK
jgi:hypothetical protein